MLSSPFCFEEEVGRRDHGASAECGLVRDMLGIGSRLLWSAQTMAIIKAPSKSERVYYEFSLQAPNTTKSYTILRYISKIPYKVILFGLSRKALGR